MVQYFNLILKFFYIYVDLRITKLHFKRMFLKYNNRLYFWSNFFVIVCNFVLAVKILIILINQWFTRFL